MILNALGKIKLGLSLKNPLERPLAQANGFWKLTLSYVIYGNKSVISKNK
jgi:hypothetical protein